MQQDENIHGWAEQHHNKGGNPNKIIRRDPTLTTKENKNQENPVKQQKTTQQKNITSPLKESTKENKQKTETAIVSKPPKNKAAILKPSDSVPPTLPTTYLPQPSSDPIIICGGVLGGRVAGGI